MLLELTEISALRDACARWRAAGDTIALVPTMGALHDGHLALVAAAKAHAARVVVSIFVNPTQFGPAEDFSRYPRPLAEDLALLRTAGADAAWLPTPEIMYPEGFATSVHVAGLSDILCGAFRPGHFDGVATVVTKLLLQVMPQMAFFGEKDYQQLMLIKRLVKDLNMETNILRVATLREKDGLARSSRNAYLSPEERTIAPQLYTTLRRLQETLANGADENKARAAAKNQLLAAGFSKIEYLELRDAETLGAAVPDASARILAAVWLGSTRLIDTIERESRP